MSTNICILGVDPGAQTGIAIVTLRASLALSTCQLYELAAADVIRGALVPLLAPVTAAVIEQFIIPSNARYRTSDAALALRVTGAAECDIVRANIPLTWQAAGQRYQVTLTQLSALGWRQPSLPHAEDALRHAVRWLAASYHTSAPKSAAVTELTHTLSHTP
jgi:hypothetical protein